MNQIYLSFMILALICVGFMCKKIPMGVTAILGALAMAAFGIISFSDAIKGFGNDVTMMIAGMMVVGNALYQSGFASKVGLAIQKSKFVGNSERRFVIIVVLLVALLSGVMSNTAVVALFLPLAGAIATQSNGKFTKKHSYMAIGISSMIGGVLTLAGSTPNVLAQGFLESTEGCQPMGFFTLSVASLPLLILMLIFYGTIGYTLQQKTFKFEEVENELDSSEEVIDDKKAYLSFAILIFCVICFICGIFTLGSVALIGACLCIVTGCISWKDAMANMDWTSICVLGGSLGFAEGLKQSGALEALSTFALNMLGGENASPAAVCIMFILLPAIAGNFMSHSAITSILTPIALSMALQLGVNPTAFAVAVCIGVTVAFVTPVGTPPVTMTLSGGYRFSDYVVVGGVLTVLCVLVSCIWVPFYYGLF